MDVNSVPAHQKLHAMCVRDLYSQSNLYVDEQINVISLIPCLLVYIFSS